MSQKYLIRIAELERLLSEQAEALRQKDQQLSLVEETEAFLRSALTRAEEKIAYSALFDHGLASKSDQRFASIRSTGNLTFSTAF